MVVERQQSMWCMRIKRTLACRRLRIIARLPMLRMRAPQSRAAATIALMHAGLRRRRSGLRHGLE
ncbi:MAG: hypothetical protein M5R42_06600 [Rhodocyclaceae bacterium]|nr:hypothetical protein [Rhodocyclaceae bacterium]